MYDAVSSGFDINSTTAEPELATVSAGLALAYDILIIVQISVMMVSMGAGCDAKLLKQNFRHPKALIVGKNTHT